MLCRGLDSARRLPAITTLTTSATAIVPRPPRHDAWKPRSHPLSSLSFVGATVAEMDGPAAIQSDIEENLLTLFILCPQPFRRRRRRRHYSSIVPPPRLLIAGSHPVFPPRGTNLDQQVSRARSAVYPRVVGGFSEAWRGKAGGGAVKAGT